jgi:erythromycin esterase
LVNVKDVPPSLAHLKQGRNKSMAKNLFYLMDSEKPNAKFMVWAHNTHIANDTSRKTVGFHLRQKLGDKYYGLSLECNEGTFQTRVMLPDGYWAELKPDTLLPAAPLTLSWYLSQAVKNNAFINLRSPSSNSVIEKWLATPVNTTTGVYVFRGASQNYETRTLKGYYDGIVFIQHSTPVHPTKNALTRSARKIGF